jgi:hypothetical protein
MRRRSYYYDMPAAGRPGRASESVTAGAGRPGVSESRLGDRDFVIQASMAPGSDLPLALARWPAGGVSSLSRPRSGPGPAPAPQRLAAAPPRLPPAPPLPGRAVCKQAWAGGGAGTRLAARTLGRPGRRAHPAPRTVAPRPPRAVAPRPPRAAPPSHAAAQGIDRWAGSGRLGRREHWGPGPGTAGAPRVGPVYGTTQATHTGHRETGV